MVTYAYTGHRPELLGGYDWNSEKNKKIINLLKEHALNLIRASEDKHFRIYFGGALGIDQMAFTIWHQIKNINTNKGLTIELYLCIPFEKYDQKWLDQKDKDRLKYQIRAATKVIYVDREYGYMNNYVPEGEYHVSKNHIRNAYMVDHAETLIAFWNEQKEGGTASCVKYARGKNKPVIVISPNHMLLQ